MAKIIVIDDDADLLRMTERALQTAEHTVSTYMDGRAGLEHVAREPPDLVITDIFMPEMEGLETIRRLRELSADLPIIAMSGMSLEGTSYLEIAAQFGARATLMKPFRVAELLALVSRVLSRA